MAFEHHHSAWIIASVITVASFVGATMYTQNRLARLDALSSTIETDSVPSIEYLSHAAVRLTRVNQLLDEGASEPQRAQALAAARQELRAVEEDVARYLALTPLPGERDLWTALRDDVDRAVRMVRSAIDAEEKTGHSLDGVLLKGDVDDVLDRAVGSVLATLDFDVKQSEVMARDVRTVRVATLRMIVMLDAVATAISLLTVIVAYRASRRHDRLLQAHNSLLDARVTELDRFAGRVAHDVLSPLGTVAAALSLLARFSDERGRRSIDRSQRALQRVQQLVEGLLTFARSGARPDLSSTCSMDAVLASVLADCSEEAAEKGIELVVEAAGPMRVRCSLGVVTSIVQNLVRNAIKYMGARPVKRIVVRTKFAGALARLEVEDTGPGIPTEVLGTIFEPFVRGAHADVSGTGLGLATVKRLVESYGGGVGVQSQRGTGTLFWVELPLVSTSSTDVQASPPSMAAHHV